MEANKNEFFDLSILLKQDELKIRRLAASGRSITVDGYFCMLSDLIRRVPGVERALLNFADCNGDRDDYRDLDNMIMLLNNMGCDRFILDFHSLLDTYGKKGNWREAAVWAKRILDEFSAFYSQIIEAKIAAKPDNLPDVTLSLKQYIKHLDEEEANRKLLILAVDDSPVILKTVLFILSNDYKVFTLTKPTELEKVLQKLTPELFLLDYQMPELNGFDLVSIIRGFEEHKDTPIVYLTSAGTFDNVTAAIALGACDFIVKPFKPDVLREKIAKHIIKKKMF